MFKKLLLLSFVFLSFQKVKAQCTLTIATGCYCEDSSQTDCDLLPDIVVSKYAILTYNGGPVEYSQSAPLPNRGRLTVTTSTPNLGFGPLQVKGVDQNGYQWFLCGTDTVSVYNPTASTNITPNCTNGATNPQQLLIQDIYHKNGSVMTFSEHKTGHMTYHPTHNHYHVDSWVSHSLRIPTADPNPLNWPIVAQGQKVGYCLMDYGNCSANPMHCQDSLGNYLTNAHFGAQYNLDDNYNCSPTKQGIGVGHLDIYWNTLDGQWITIPPGTCNGLYAIVMEVDPDNVFVESREDNNYTFDYWNLTNQTNTNPIVEIHSHESAVVCQGDSIELHATAGLSFLWSTGETTQTIMVPSTTMDYTCLVQTYCGTLMTPPFHVTEVLAPSPIVTGDTVCTSGSAILTALGTGIVNWYDSTHTWLASGSIYNTPVINVPTMYYAENVITHPDTVHVQPEDYSVTNGGYSTADRYLVFDCLSPFVLLNTTVWSNATGNRTITLEDSMGVVLQSTTVNIGLDKQVVPLNFSITPGVKYRLHCTSPLGLYRNLGNGVSYPYEVPGVVSIWNSDQGNGGYFYFYNWEIATTNSTCASVSVPVLADVQVCNPLQLSEVLETSVDIYPNPNEGQFVVRYENPTGEKVFLEVNDLVGAVVYQKNFGTEIGLNKQELDLRKLSKGVYLLQLHHADKTMISKIVIR